MATISKATGLPIGLRSKSSSCTTTGASERTSLIPPNSPARRPVQRRRVSGSYRGTSSSKSCFNLPPSLEALDLPAFRGATGSNGPIATLVTLRVQVLSYLDDLETRLSHFASSPDMQELGFFYRGADSDGDEAQDPLLSRMDMGEAERAGAKDGEGGANSDAAEIAMEELQEWARDGLEMLRRIREDVCAYLPSFNLDDVSLDAVKARLADLPDITDVHVPDAVLKMRRNMSMSDVMAHLPDFPELPELPDFPNLANMPHMPNMPNMPDFDFPDFDFRTRFSDVKTALSDLDFRAPASYLPTLSAHLGRLQAHLASKASSSSAQALDFASLAPSTLSDLLDRLLSSDFVKNITSGEPDEEDNILERTAKDLARAMKQSMDGAKLIAYQDLPHAWRNNHFVTSGYRFVFEYLGFGCDVNFSDVETTDSYHWNAGHLSFFLCLHCTMRPVSFYSPSPTPFNFDPDTT
jgi:adiponectin receptor